MLFTNVAIVKIPIVFCVVRIDLACVGLAGLM